LGRKFPGFTCRRSSWTAQIVTQPHPPSVSLSCHFQDGCAVHCATPWPQWSRVSSSLYRTRTAQTRRRTFIKGASRVWVESRRLPYRSAFCSRAGKDTCPIFHGSLLCTKGTSLV